MNKKESYTRIVINRTDLFSACASGFVAHIIGSLWCEGWVLTKSLDSLPVSYRVDK